MLNFRLLVLQAMHGLSLAQTGLLVAGRLSWMRFRGPGPGDAVSDADTLWDFREALFARLDRAITEAGCLPMAGQIVDATLVAAPRQRNTKTGKARIKAGETAGDIWPGKPAKSRQKDTDARWTVMFSKARPAAVGKPQGRPMPKHTVRQREEVRSARPCRAPLRPPEGANASRDPHHRHRARHRARNVRQHDPRHEAMVLARRAEPARLTPKGPQCATSAP